MDEGLKVMLEEDFFDPPDPDAASKVLSKLVNADDIQEYIRKLQQRVRIAQKKKGNLEKLMTNYSFVGAPGTGKTTVARAFGEIFHSLGLLASSMVVECKATELKGRYVGHSAPLVTYVPVINV